METALYYLNSRIVEEHGKRVTESSMWIDAEVDSFGTTVIFLDMDAKYTNFSNDWFSSVDWMSLSIKDILDRAANESK